MVHRVIGRFLCGSLFFDPIWASQRNGDVTRPQSDGVGRLLLGMDPPKVSACTSLKKKLLFRGRASSNCCQLPPKSDAKKNLSGDQIENYLYFHKRQLRIIFRQNMRRGQKLPTTPLEKRIIELDTPWRDYGLVPRRA